jgi:hypothetical protein
MKGMYPMKLLAPMVLILGAALPASAQTPSSTAEQVGCYIDLTIEPRIPNPHPPDLPNFRARFLTTDSLVNCPGNTPAPNIQVNCRLLIGPGWPAGLKINNNKTHVCLIDGEQCNFPNPPGAIGYKSDNTKLLIEPVVINGEVFGDAQLRCQNKNNS